MNHLSLSRAFSPLRCIFFLFGLYACSLPARAQNGEDDPTFNDYTATNGSVRGHAVQPDGKIILVGEFTYFARVYRPKIVRMNASGTIDNSFSVNDGLTNATNYFTYGECAVVQPDGRILVGGSFNAYNGVTAMNVVRLNANGSRDITFNSSLTQAYPIYSMCVQPDGKILVGGGYPNSIKRLNADGTQDATFSPVTLYVSGSINSIIVQSDGKILVGGAMTYVGGSNLIRLNADGSQDTGFTPVNFGSVHSMILKNDGTLLVATDVRIALLNPSGTAAAGFTPVVVGGGSSTYVQTIAQQADGKIVAGGSFATINGVTKNGIVRISPAGVVDAAFSTGTGFNSSVNEASVLSNGNIFLSGMFKVYNAENAFYFIHLNSNGSTAWAANAGDGVDLAITSSAVHANGKIIVGGDFTLYNSVSRNRVARLKSNGYLDLSFSPGTGADDGVLAVGVQSDEKVIVGGRFLNFNGVARNRIVRLNENGTLDATFAVGTGANNYVKACAIQPDGKIIIGGDFTSYNGTAVGRIARLNTDGSLDATFATGTGFNGSVHAILIQPDGQILVTGAYNQFNGTARYRVARLDPSGTVETAFFPGGGYNNGSVDCIALQPDGKLVIGGHFNSYSNTSLQRVARLNANGTTDMTFTPGVSIYNYPYSLAVQPDGRIIIGAGSISRINSNGSDDPSFPYQTATQFDVRTMQTGVGGNILAFGNFYYTNLPFKKGTARLKTMPVISTTQTISACGSYTWINGITYTSSNSTATYAAITSGGTDSIVTLNLTLQPFSYAYENQIACGQYTWPQTGLTYSASGQYSDTVANTVGCDSILVLNLTIGQPSGISFSPTACEQYTWIQTGLTYTVSGQYTDTVPNTAGCDSIVMLNLTITQPTASSDNQTACEQYTWAQTGLTYTISGLYTDTISGTVGCDSVVTLNLTITHPTASSVNAAACEHYTWPQTGLTYTVSGQYNDTVPNMGVCDSIITLNLTITQPTAGLVNATACEQYEWVQTGLTYTVSGQYNDTVPNTAGCDSIITLNLTITQPTASLVNETACEQYEWPQTGLTYTVSGQYNDTLSNAAGCDSIITLNLTITQPTAGSVSETACGDYTWLQNGVTYTLSGQYNDTIPNAAGCDSVVTLNLTLVPAVPILVSSFSMPADTNDCTGAASVSITGNAGFSLELDGGAPVVSSGYSLLTGLCPGVHDLFVTDNCGDTTSYPLVIPIASNYVFNNPFIDSLALDSLGETVADCSIFYNTIQSAYIDSIFATGNTVTVIWNIVDAGGSNLDTVSYVLNNGNGVYYLQLNVFCPSKALGDYFTVTQSIWFNNGSVATAGLVQQAFGDQLSIYPNPTGNGKVTIAFNGPAVQLAVFDLAGRTLLRTPLTSGEEVSLEELPSGVYLFHISSERGNAIRHVVKQ